MLDAAIVVILIVIELIKVLSNQELKKYSINAIIIAITIETIINIPISFIRIDEFL
jgi:hypothetical protein